MGRAMYIVFKCFQVQMLAEIQFRNCSFTGAANVRLDIDTMVDVLPLSSD